MKKIAILFLVASISAQQQTTQTQPAKNNQNQLVQQKTVDSDADTTRIVLEKFAIVLNHFSIIVADPNNGKNVGANMAGIFGNIITIAAQAFKRSHQELEKNLDQLEEMFIELCNDPEFCKQLLLVVDQEATRIKRAIRRKP